MLFVVGLGPGDPGLVTRQAWELLRRADRVYLRTRIHPTVPHLPEGPVYHSFDDVYEREENFARVYEEIVRQLVEQAEGGKDVVYAVPGDPMVAEGTVKRLLAVCGEKQIGIKMISGVSFIEPALAALGKDAIEGLQLLDATDVAATYHPLINPDFPALIAQLYARHLASDVKLTLMNQYPDEHRVILIHAAGTSEQCVEDLLLYEIDQRELTHLTSLYLPPYDNELGVVTSLEGFQNTMAHLRAPDGCPWDRKQTHQSLRRNLLEEAYEVLDAIDADDPKRMREEFGDLLLQIVLHAQIGVDEGEFNMAEVIRTVDSKIKRRHPHVWGDVDVQDDSERVSTNWEQIKAQERDDKGETGRSLLDGVPKILPALAQAHEYDSRAARVGFDWPEMQGVVDKLREELGELEEAATPEEQFQELGDVLFVVATWARWLKINPEDALRAANRRFYERFSYVERRARQQGRAFSQMSFEELDALWNEAKEDRSACQSDVNGDGASKKDRPTS